MQYELQVGLRYTRARRGNRFFNVNALVAIIGIVVGVWALIVVLSVINGFSREVRLRILGVAAHVQITGLDNRLTAWRDVIRIATKDSRVVAAAPFVQGQAMLSAGQAVRGALIRGVLPNEEQQVNDIAQHMQKGSLQALRPGEFGVVLGSDLARALRVAPGDKIAFIVPQGEVSATEVIPQLKQYTVVGTFEVGFADADSGLALVQLRDAQALYGLQDSVSGVRLKLDDPFAAPKVARELISELPPDVVAFDWTRAYVNFFRAAEIAKRMISTVLVLIILVAAINIVSTLVVGVANKRADIAILRTMGASPLSVMQIFVVQGMLIGAAGTAIGALLGIVTALNIDTLVPAIEQLFNVKFLAKDIYLIPELPSDLRVHDVALVCAVSLALTLVATIYPSWRAARVNPAEALRYE
jgi:lipoprotein-releasing system permease protein